MRHTILLCSLALATPGVSAAAQPVAEDGPVPSDVSPPVAVQGPDVAGAQTFTPADFARFAPRTALDMLSQVPGFSIVRSDDRRGLGQASGNVLINGQRSSGKSNDAVTELGRISAAAVVRIEIVDGSTLDVPGLTGQVANVIVRTTGLSGNFAWRPQIRARRLPARLTNGEVSLSGTVGRTGYTVSAENDSFRQGNNGPELLILPDGLIADRRAEDLRIVGEQPRISLGLKRTSAGGSIANFNGPLFAERQTIIERSLRSGPGLPDRDRLLDDRRRARGYEAGGDYEFALGAGRLKLIGLRRFERETSRQTVTTAAAARDAAGDRFEQTSTSAETIGRTEYRWKAGVADWQLSAEGALNVLAADNALASLNAAGAFVPVPLSGSAATVRELRGEAIASYGRPLAPTLALQLSAGAELSGLTQSGPAGKARRFLRPKGSASLAWKASPRLFVSLALERQVGQLDFGDFVASANLSAETSNVGNPDLVPPQSWRVDLEGRRSFDGWGTLSARVYGRRITDIVDVVPIGVEGQALGNLDRATVYGTEITGTLNFDPIGLAGAKLDANVQLQTSSLVDPVTDRTRPISSDLRRSVSLTYRHDIAGSDWAYGAGYDEYSQRPNARIDQVFLDRSSIGNLGAFVENKDVRRLTVRGSVDNLLGTGDRLDRQFFDRRRTAALLATETRDRAFGLIFTVSVSGNL